MGSSGSGDRKRWRRGRLVALVPAGLAAVIVAMAWSTAPRPASATPAAVGPRPNVVVLMTDDQTADSLWAMPNVRRLLAKQGTTFDNSFATTAQCCPSRATFLTGRYPHNHGVVGNVPPYGGFTKLDHTETLPVWLQRAGYYTSHIGKYLNGYGAPGSTKAPPGWSDWRASVDPSTYQFYGYTLNEDGRLVTYGTDAGSYQTDVYARLAVDIIRRSSGRPQPLFLSVAFLAPHEGGPVEPDDPPGLGTPVPAPRHRGRFTALPVPKAPSFNEADASDKPSSIRALPPLTGSQIGAIEENYRQRLETLLAVDEAVAAVVQALADARILKRTLIVFTSDNGFFHGEHRLSHGKVLVYEPSIRVPLIIRGPDVPRDRRIAALVGNIDLTPTILDATGVTPARFVDGRSLLPLARAPRTPWRRELLIERSPQGGLTNHVFTAVRTPGFLYAEYVDGQRELYDLRRDPHQLTSRHDDPAYAGVRRDLARRLRALRACAGRSCRVARRACGSLFDRARCAARSSWIRVRPG